MMRVEQHDCTDGEGFIGQSRIALVGPQPSRDRGSNEEQDDENILKLGEELSPRRDRRVCRQLVPAVSFESRSRIFVAQALTGVRTECGDNQLERLLIDGYLIHWYRPRQTRHIVT